MGRKKPCFIFRKSYKRNVIQRINKSTWALFITCLQLPVAGEPPLYKPSFFPSLPTTLHPHLHPSPTPKPITYLAHRSSFCCVWDTRTMPSGRHMVYRHPRLTRQNPHPTGVSEQPLGTIEGISTIHRKGRSSALLQKGFLPFVGSWSLRAATTEDTRGLL